MSTFTLLRRWLSEAVVRFYAIHDGPWPMTTPARGNNLNKQLQLRHLLERQICFGTFFLLLSWQIFQAGGPGWFLFINWIISPGPEPERTRFVAICVLSSSCPEMVEDNGWELASPGAAFYTPCVLKHFTSFPEKLKLCQMRCRKLVPLVS